MARERGLQVDVAGFHELMEQQKARARAAQKKQVIELSEVETKTPTHFIGYDHHHTGADVQEVLSVKGKTVVIANNSVCYAEMGGQVGDTGEIAGPGGNTWRIANTQKSGHTWLHFLEETDGPAVGDHVTIQLDDRRRGAIQRHHTVTHLLHWALHEVVSKEATQKGSFVGPDKLTFDFNSAALTPGQVRDIERLVNERIVENAGVSWIEVPYADVRGHAGIMQFFGDKYGETVRVVQIGGQAAKLDGYSMELCAGTHTRATGEIGLFRINAESAIAAGVRRIEAVAGLHAYDLANADTQRLHALATKIGTPLPELEKRLDGLLAQQKDLEKALKSAQQREAAGRAKDLLASAETINGLPAIIAHLGAVDGDTLQTVADALKSHGFKGVTVLGGSANGAVALVAAVSSDFLAQAQAGKIIQAIAPLVGGKGGGKPEGARGGGKDPAKLEEALAHARTLLR
jgi:alanyl-tRNA synthetase